ncbi:MAG: hypothetical protein Q8N19_06300, partial [Phenylobacterium sp.]|nr:hypothetical protein [Phenylobacterium sp.]
SIDRITDFTAADDTIGFGITGSATNYAEISVGTYAQALSDASALITSGSRDIVAVQVGADVFVFADISSNNTVTGTVQLMGITLAGVSETNFTA